jgi:hypothetical protein
MEIHPNPHHPQPWHELVGGCATCRHWMRWEETAPRLVAECGRDKKRRDFNHMPKNGCVFWKREVGADDHLLLARDIDE